MREFWVLELLGAKPVDDPASGKYILERLITDLPELRPVRFGTDEPLRKKWENRLLDDLATLWPQYPDDFLWKAEGEAEGEVASIAGNHPHSVVLLVSPNDSAPTDERALEFLSAIGEYIDADFGLIHRLVGEEVERALRAGTIASSGGAGFIVTSHHLAKGLPDLYWATFLGRRYVSLFGIATINSAPTGAVTWLQGGSAILTVVPNSMDVVENSADFGKARRAIIDHLGQDAFFDANRPDMPRRIPAFDDSISRSLRIDDPVALAQAMERFMKRE